MVKVNASQVWTSGAGIVAQIMGAIVSIVALFLNWVDTVIDPSFNGGGTGEFRVFKSCFTYTGMDTTCFGYDDEFYLRSAVDFKRTYDIIGGLIILCIIFSVLAVFPTVVGMVEGNWVLNTIGGLLTWVCAGCHACAIAWLWLSDAYKTEDLLRETHSTSRVFGTAVFLSFGAGGVLLIAAVVQTGFLVFPCFQRN